MVETNSKTTNPEKTVKNCCNELYTEKTVITDAWIYRYARHVALVTNLLP